MTKKELKVRFPPIKIDDEFVFDIDEYRHDELELSFWVRNDVVFLVTIYPEFNDVI